MRRAAVILSLAALSATSGFAQHIEVTRNGTRPTILGPDSAYTGRAVADVLFAATKENPIMAVNVTFEPGARTAWHSHHAGQYLIITSGVGWVQERGGKKRVVRPGDVVWTPPGVVHWHGATTTNAMSHLAVWQFVDGSGGDLFEHVSDKDYLAEPAAD